MPGGVDRQLEQVTLTSFGALGQSLKFRCEGRLVTLCTELAETRDLRLSDRGIVDLEDLEMVFLFEAVLVDSYDRLLARVDSRLRPRRRFLDTKLRQPGFDRLGHPAKLFDLLDVLPSSEARARG